jgi:hypothetical protein
MFYQNFEHYITRAYRITVDNWPLPTFQSPSSIGSYAELELLYRSWSSGVTAFRTLSDQEWRAWTEGQVRGTELPPVNPAPVTNENDPPTGTQPSTSSHATSLPMAGHAAALAETSAPLTNTPNTHSHPDNTARKQRKQRSDKGKARGPRNRTRGILMDRDVVFEQPTVA